MSTHIDAEAGGSSVDSVRAANPTERLLEESWGTRSRRATVHELKAEAVAGLLFLACAVPLAIFGIGTQSVDAGLAALLVALYAAVSRIEYPIGAGYVVPSYLVLVPMFVLLPPAIVPLLVAAGLLVGAFSQWVTRGAGPERLLFSIPDAWHSVGPALVLVLFGSGHPAGEQAVIYVAAFLAACLFDLASATLREAAALQVAPKLQIRVLARVWMIDACLAPIGLLAAQSASAAPARVFLILPLGALLLILARDRSARIAQAQRRLEQALTDPLTRLGNRRLLADDLRDRLAGARAGEPALLILFDLDGFKVYNDTFGHPAGDALLERLGGKLAEAARPGGKAYRLGGDEFCVLIGHGPDGFEQRVIASVEALTDDGGEFKVRASYGIVLLPDEADDPDHALQLADQRMYARKHGQVSGIREQARDVLMRSIHAREPALGDHSVDVAELAGRIGRRLGMSGERIDELTRAAELHDLGKVGVPDAILDKPAELDDGEWEFMRQHTILGERILNAAPAMRPVARIVRSTHERWDGHGYPDGLTGERIPLSARVVSVCDAYEAMVSDRPYRAAIGHEAACCELRREAGRQFDPAVVVAFLEEIAIGRAGAAPQPREHPRTRALDDVTAHLRELMALRTHGGPPSAAPAELEQRLG